MQLPRALTIREIEQAKQKLPEALPKNLFHCYSTWQRILDFHSNSQSFMEPKPGARFATNALTRLSRQST